jgi:hypothetical protein
MAIGELAAVGTAIAPGIGTAIGAAVGLGIDIFNFFSGDAQKKQQSKIENAYSAANMELQIKVAQQNKSAIQDFLSKMPTAGEALKTSTGDTEFDQQYKQMLAQFGNVNVIAGMTGRVGAGTSMQAVGKEAEQQVKDLVATTAEQSRRQLDIYNTTIDTLTPALQAVKDAEKENTSGLFGHGGFLGIGIG